MVVIEPLIIEPVIEPAEKSAPIKELFTILLPETELSEKSANVTPEYAKYSVVIVLSEIIPDVIARSAILSVVTAPFTK